MFRANKLSICRRCYSNLTYSTHTLPLSTITTHALTCIADGAESVGDDEDSAPTGKYIQSFLHHVLALCIKRTVVPLWVNPYSIMFAM